MALTQILVHRWVPRTKILRCFAEFSFVCGAGELDVVFTHLWKLNLGHEQSAQWRVTRAVRFRCVRAPLDSATSRNVAIQLVLQQCCKDKLHVFCCPFIRLYLKIRTNHNRVQLREGGEHWVTPARAAAKETTNSTPGEWGGGVLPYMA